MTTRKLFTEFELGRVRPRNRIVMAPMTRGRADGLGVLSEMTVTYYRQRAGAGLIISEATNISEQAIGSPNTPGIYTESQISAWRRVTDAVHEAGGLIFCQLWHTGRVGHSLVKNGELPVAPSALAIRGQEHYTSAGMKPYEVPRALSTGEVRKIVEDYGTAATNALAAGFDGVELHAAFGYLPNQFLVDASNQRNDEYGGSIENRTRFALEIMRLLVRVCGDGRVGIKLSPVIPYNGMVDSNPVELYDHLIAELNYINLAYVHLMGPLFPLDQHPDWPRDVIGTFGRASDWPIIANGGYDAASAESELQQERAELVSFGNLFIANPDLPERFRRQSAFNELDRRYLYMGGERGYIDYPALPS